MKSFPSGDLGELAPGRQADITILQLEEQCEQASVAVDCAGQRRELTRLLRPRYVMRQGVLYNVKD